MSGDKRKNDSKMCPAWGAPWGGDMRLLIAFNVAVLLSNVIVAQQARASEPGSDVQFAPPGATSVESRTMNGSAQIHFDYSERYPAHNLIAALNNELLSLGWTPRPI